MPRGRRRRNRQPNRTQYKSASSIDTTTESGVALLDLQRIERFRQVTDFEKRKQNRRFALQYIDGEAAVASGGDDVYLNEALPALEDLIFSTLPGLPETRVEARQPDQEELADMIEALVDATLTSGLCRAYDALLAMRWDELGWGIGIVKTAWLEVDKPQLYRPTYDVDYLTPHVQAALAENKMPERLERGAMTT